MITSFRILAASLLAAMALASCSLAGSEDADSRGPVVLAPSSMTEVIEDIADAWAAKGYARPILSLAGTPSLARQVEAGAPADIVIAADQEWMDWLSRQGLVQAESQRVLAGNALVYAVRDQFNDADMAIGANVPFNRGRLAMGDPDTVPAGRYARAALAQAGLWDSVAASVVPTDNVRAALILVERGEAQIGIVYASDLAAASEVKSVAFQHDLPEGMAITYPAALLTSAGHTDAAALLAFLESDEAAAMFCARGFTMPAGRAQC